MVLQGFRLSLSGIHEHSVKVVLDYYIGKLMISSNSACSHHQQLLQQSFQHCQQHSSSQIISLAPAAPVGQMHQWGVLRAVHRLYAMTHVTISSRSTYSNHADLDLVLSSCWRDGHVQGNSWQSGPVVSTRCIQAAMAAAAFQSKIAAAACQLSSVDLFALIMCLLRFTHPLQEQDGARVRDCRQDPC